MTPRRAPAAAIAALACAVVLGGCLGDDDEPAENAPIKGHVLRLYSSLPAEGPSAGVARAVAAGQRQALVDAHRRAGRYRIQFVQLNSTKPGSGIWDPGQVAENASRAARDPRAIAYLGELGLGASAVSVPVTNEAGLLQVSPGDGLTSLTREPPGRSAAGPERYFPSERRNFLRLVPADLAQAELLVDRMEALGIDRPALVVGTGVYARELANQLVAEAHDAGIEPIETKELPDDHQKVLDLPRELLEIGPDAVLLAVARNRDTSALIAGLGRALPQARLLTGSGVLVGQSFARAVPVAASWPLEAVAPLLSAGRGGAAARQVLRRIERDQGLESARPEALWGYESVEVVLDAIEAAQRNGEPAGRADVVREALAARVRESPIGTYEVHPGGAVEGIPLGLYRLDGERFELMRTLR